MITHEMRICADELTRAFLVFLRERPALKVYRRVLIFSLSLLLALIILRLFVEGWSWTDAGIFSAGFLWLVFGSRFTRWRIKKQIQLEQMGRKKMTTHLTHNGIQWEGDGIKTASIPWQRCKYVLETSTGFILVLGGGHKFLWLPFSGFKESKETVRKLFLQKNCKVKPRAHVVV